MWTDEDFLDLWRRRSWSVIGLVVLLLIGLSKMPYPSLHNALLVPIYGTMILSLASAQESIGNPILTLLGESSYSLYLLSSPTRMWCLFLTKRCGMSGQSIVNIGYLVMLLLFSIASYKLIEIPGRMFIRSRLITRDRKPLALTDRASEIAA